jgi:erythrin-vacuolar iron transport family protein
MGKEYTVQEALHLAIKAEKDSRDFYLKAASLTTNDRAQRVFRLLAAEEEEHLASFFAQYRGGDFGNLAAFLASAPDTLAAGYAALTKAVDRQTVERKALELALLEEKAIIDQYGQFARDIVDPHVRGIFERVVSETRKHYQLIEAEYAYHMGMVHDADQDIFVRE